MMKMIATASPEEMGIPSEAIDRLLNRLERCDIPMHSLLLARHGKMVFEGYYAPYEAGTLHRMFSVTKSLVSLAIGCMEAEGRIRLDDCICVYFPEFLPEKVHPLIAAMTIRDMLQMKTCYSGTTYDKSSTTKNWVESFFTSVPSHPAGTIFNYDTSASHTLCALVEKLSGKNLLDYLRDCFLDDIGFSKESYILKDPFGSSMGGSGLMALPSDLMRLGLLLMNNIDEAQTLYPKTYIEQALSYHSSTIMNAPTKEEAYGYGYQFWKIGHDGYSCYGMGGQLLLCYPEKDLICITTADTQDIKGGNQMIYDSLYEEVFPYLMDTPLPPCPLEQASLKKHQARLTLPVLSISGTAPSLQLQDKQLYHLEPNNTGFLTMGISMSSESSGTLNFSTNEGIHTLPFGFGKLVTGIFPVYKQRCASSACWVTPHTLYIRCWLIDECTASVHFQLDFSHEQLTVFMKKNVETTFQEFQGFLNGSLRSD